MEVLPDAVDTQAIVQDLIAGIGASLTAFVADSDEATIKRWAAGLSQPSDCAWRALSAVSQAYNLIVSAESVGVARAWLSGTNPELDGQSPAEALNEAKCAQVAAVARRYVRHG